VTGEFRESATFGSGEPNQTILTTAGEDDIFIARYNPNGTLAWAKRAGGTAGEGGFGITTLSDDSTIVAGGFSGSATFGPGETNQTILTSAEYDNIFVARYNPNGTLAWAKRAGGTGGFWGDNGGYGVTAFPDNSIVVTGTFGGSATFGPGESNQTILTSAGRSDIFVARYNPDGTLSWAKRAGGEFVDKSCAITALSDNSTVVTGNFYASATFGLGESNQTILTCTGIYDIFIARYNPDGTLSWAKRAGGSCVCYSYGITTLSDDSTVVTGKFFESATFGLGEPKQTILTSSGEYDLFIARYNADGRLSWAKRAGGSVSVEGYGITMLSNDSTVVTGTFYASAIFGECEPNKTTLSAPEGLDIFIARFEP